MVESCLLGEGIVLAIDLSNSVARGLLVADGNAQNVLHLLLCEAGQEGVLQLGLSQP